MGVFFLCIYVIKFPGSAWITVLQKLKPTSTDNFFNNETLNPDKVSNFGNKNRENFVKPIIKYKQRQTWALTSIAP